MRLAILVLLYWMMPALAQQAPTAALVSDPLVESYQPEVAVSGNVIVGVMSAAAGSALARDRVGVLVSSTAGGTSVCLRAASRDGIYASRNLYTLPADTTGTIRLPYRSAMTDVVGAYSADEIALVAHPGDCETTPGDYLLVSEAGETGTVDAVIYLNSFGATDVFIQRDQEVRDCEYISEGRRTTFDFICRPGKVEPGVRYPLMILRERFGREQPPVELTIIGGF